MSLRVVASAAVACLTLANPASATTISDTLNIFAPGGALFESIVVPEAQGNEGGHRHIATIAANLGADPIVLTENGTISDIIGVFRNGTFGFLSDHFNGKPLTLGNLMEFRHAASAIVIGETAGFIDATSFISKPFQRLGYTAEFASDFVAATPLPAALPLFASGVGVMGWLARRRKRRAAMVSG
jgi:hypothetical protein